MCGRGIDQAHRCFAVAEVSLEKDRLAADFTQRRDHLLALGFGPTVHDDACTFANESTGNTFAQALGRARHESDLSCEQRRVPDQGKVEHYSRSRPAPTTASRSSAGPAPCPSNGKAVV